MVERLLATVQVTVGIGGRSNARPRGHEVRHVRHERLFRWLEAAFPQGRLYGPYRHGGREYFQWMVRGPFLRDVLVPFLAARREYMDDHVASRFDDMCARYGLAAPTPRKPGV